jgi:hypothetical protein
MRCAFLITLFLASGCTMVGSARVEGWPELRVFEHHVPHQAMRDRCMKYTAAFMDPQACAEFYLVQGECHIWFSKDFPPSASIVEHEREHCRGYEHAGESGLKAMLEQHISASAGR